MEEDCPICLNSYDKQMRYPMILCIEQHMCCEDCSKQLQKGGKYCPQCRAPIQSARVKKFRIYQKMHSVKQKAQILSKEHEQLKKQMKFLVQQEKSNNQAAEKIPLRQNQKPRKNKLSLIYKQKNLTIFQIQQLILRNQYKDDGIFIGLGSKEQSISFKKPYALQWYEKKYENISKFSLYDQLTIKAFQEDKTEYLKSWYLELIKKDSQNYKAHYQLGLIEHNNQNHQNAFSYYKQVIKLKPDFDKPYEMLAFIYLEEKDYQMAADYAQMCLKANPDNIFAIFIAAISKDSKDNKKTMKNMEQVYSNTRLLRGLYQFGVCHMKDKNYNQAIKIFIKCIQEKHQYFEAHFSTAQCYLMQKNGQCITTLKNLLYKKLTSSQRFSCLFNLAIIIGCYQIKEKSPYRHQNSNSPIQYIDQCLIFEEFGISILAKKSQIFITSNVATKKR